MSDLMTPRLNKLPFWVADVLLLTAAVCLVVFGGRPLEAWAMLAVTLCVALGGWMAILPFLREYDAAVGLAGHDRLQDATGKITQLEDVAGRIASATSQWQQVQDRAQQTAQLAQEIADRLAREAEGFATAVSRTADAEKQTLKLEVDKLRRAEGDWLQVVGRIMDHTFALHLAAVRSGQPAVQEQIERFHGACRDALRKVGFTSLVAMPDEPFDPRRHQAAEGSTPDAGARVDETVAPGFVFQGRLLRPVMVRLAVGAPVATDGQPQAIAAEEAAPGPTSADGAASDLTGEARRGDPASAAGGS